MKSINKDKIFRIGRYLILDDFNDGGMGKINLALLLGDDVNKVVIIKRIKQKFFGENLYEKMFLDEIKITIDFNHSGIVHVFDYGRIDGQLFLVIEYVEGKNLSDFLIRLRQRHLVIPLEISVHIISMICQALHYAHNFTNKLTGIPANIIHRDVSPENIMITYSGTVKLIDFGVVKSESNTGVSEAHSLKGKLSYMAPEYIEEKELDHRLDIYSTGVVLWELLCNKQLFAIDSRDKLAILKKIQLGDIPTPSSINPNIPDELDKIVLKMLSKNPADRYPDMDTVSRALTKLLYLKYPDFNAADLKNFTTKLFAKEKEFESKYLLEVGKLDLSPYLNEAKMEITNAHISNKEITSNPVEKSNKDPDKNNQTEFQEKYSEMIFESDSIFMSGNENFVVKKNNKDEIITKKQVKATSQKASAKEVEQQQYKEEEEDEQDNETYIQENDNFQDSELGFNSKSLISEEPVKRPIIKEKRKRPPVLNKHFADKKKEPGLTLDLQSNIVFYENNNKKIRTDLTGDSGFQKKISPYTKIKRNLTILIILSILLVTLSQLPPVKRGYAKLMGYNAYIKLTNFSSKRVRLYLNKTRVSYSKKGIIAPLHQELFLQVVKRNYPPFIKKIYLKKNNQKIKIKVPRFKKHNVGYLKCIGKDLPKKSFLKIIMPKTENNYFAKVPFKKITLPVGKYKAYYQGQELEFKITKNFVSSFRLK